MTKHKGGMIFVCGKQEFTFAKKYHDDDCPGCAEDKLRRDEELNKIDKANRKLRVKGKANEAKEAE